MNLAQYVFHSFKSKWYVYTMYYHKSDNPKVLKKVGKGNAVGTTRDLIKRKMPRGFFRCL